MARSVRILLLAMWGGLAVPAAITQEIDVDKSISAYRDRMLAQSRPEIEKDRQALSRWAATAQVIRPSASQPSLPEREALVTQPYQGVGTPTPLEVLAEIADPRYFEDVFGVRLDRVKSTAREARVVKNYERVIDKARGYMTKMQHKRTVEMSLAECIQRALSNNYAIRAAAYDPAIADTNLVEAEAVFDAVFFLETNYAHTDTPASTWEGDNPQTNSRGYRGGFRKLLPTGMRVETSLGQQGVRSTLEPKQNTFINPAWSTTFTATLTQPLLRGFGLDYNRSLIEIRKVDRQISREQFLQEVRDRLFEVEQAYWTLARVRRIVLISVESVAQNEVTFENIKARETIDATPVDIGNARTRWQGTIVQLQNSVRAVRELEDTLKNLMNDPELLLSEDIEIIPTDSPFAAPLAVDQFAEVRTALDERNEIITAKLTIEQARINTARAKGDTLPRLDLSFQYEVDGLRRSPDSSFDNLTTNRYNSYNVILAFEVPIGQRAERAAYQRARLQESQGIVRLKQVIDGVVQEVNNAVRALMNNWENVPPALDQVISADRSLRAAQERADTVNPSFLELELNSVERLTNARATLLQNVIDYNIAIVGLERAKGTLLQYNNVVPADASPRR